MQNTSSKIYSCSMYKVTILNLKQILLQYYRFDLLEKKPLM